MAAFSFLSLIAIWWLFRAFEMAPYGDKFWAVPAWWLWVQAALVLFALILAFGGLFTPNPAAPGGAKLLENRNVAQGIFAITRHPVMWGTAIWAIAHMIGEATERGFAFFGAFAATVTAPRRAGAPRPFAIYASHNARTVRERNPRRHIIAETLRCERLAKGRRQQAARRLGSEP
jgi:uncharacterized membrane protein